MNLLFPHLADNRPSCTCKRPRHRLDGSCRTCGGDVPDDKVMSDVPFSEIWWPYSEAENAA